MDISKIIMLGGGGYVLYRVLTGQSIIPALTTGTTDPAVAGTSSATVQPQNTPTPVAVTAAVQSTTMASVLAAATAAMGAGWNGMLNGDQWNYFYQQARGIPGPDPTLVWPNRDRSFLMSVNEWWAGASAQPGISGLGGYAYGVWRRTPYWSN